MSKVEENDILFTAVFRVRKLEIKILKDLKNFVMKERNNLALYNTNFGFFVSLMVMKIFCFENKYNEGWIFK